MCLFSLFQICGGTSDHLKWLEVVEVEELATIVVEMEEGLEAVEEGREVTSITGVFKVLIILGTKKDRENDI